LAVERTAVRFHEQAENLWYVLRGKGLVELAGERILLDPHTRVFIPPGVKHGNLDHWRRSRGPGEVPGVTHRAARDVLRAAPALAPLPPPVRPGASPRHQTRDVRSACNALAPGSQTGRRTLAPLLAGAPCR